jgi:hypothetical protein
MAKTKENKGFFFVSDFREANGFREVRFGIVPIRTARCQKLGRKIAIKK